MNSLESGQPCLANLSSMGPQASGKATGAGSLPFGGIPAAPWSLSQRSDEHMSGVTPMCRALSWALCLEPAWSSVLTPHGGSVQHCTCKQDLLCGRPPACAV